MAFEITQRFSECLLWLVASAPAGLKDRHYELLEGLNQLPDAVLEHFLGVAPDPLQELPGLVLLPPLGERVPLLHLAHGTEHEQDMLRMTLVVVGIDDNAGPVAMAWRYESPEGPGEHCYWHCQPVRRLRAGVHAPPLERLPEWLFDDMPTIPVSARDPDELLLALLVSVYGHREFGRMQRQDFQDRFHESLAALDDA